MKNKQFAFKKYFFLVLVFAIFFVGYPCFATDYYWENPEKISKSDSRFSLSASNSNGTAIVVWQEIVNKTANGGQIYLSARVALPNAQNPEWKDLSRFAGPFDYSGDIPNIFSVSVNEKNVISVAVLSSSNSISVFTSTDFGTTFTETQLGQMQGNLIAPRIYRTCNDNFMLFATQGQDENFSLWYASSANGVKWSSFETFLPASGMLNAFIPTLIALPNKDIVVFQASYSNGSRFTYQLYSTERSLGSSYWSNPVMITNAVIDEYDFFNYHNQRASLLYSGGKLYMAWERTYYTSENASIYVAELNLNGKIIDGGTKLTSVGNASLPLLFMYDNKLNIVWFDTRRGISSIYFAERNGFIWSEKTLTQDKYGASFSSAIITKDGSLNFFWQQESSSTASITQLSPDTTVSKPKLIAQSFTEGKRSTSSTVKSTISFPSDSSGIAGYSYSWTQNASTVPPLSFMNTSNNNSLVLNANSDGKWFLKVRTMDYAGNWSDYSTLEYFRDTTPPGKPTINIPQLDDFGFLAKNTYNVTWNSPDDDDVAGYTYNLQYLGDFVLPEELETLSRPIAKLPTRILTKTQTASYYNTDDGLWAFSVSAIDTVGNIGEKETIYLLANKYIPYTNVTSISKTVDDFGNVSLSVFGRDFTRDGVISHIYLSKDAKDIALELSLENGEYKIPSNKVITNLDFSELEEGSYKIGLYHTGRGLYWTKNILTIENYGNVKIGNFANKYIPSWKTILFEDNYAISMPALLVVIAMIFSLIGIVFSFNGIASTAKESILIRTEVISLLKGEDMPLEKKAKAKKLKKRFFSLKLKLVMFTSALVILIVLLISLPLGLIMINTQEQTLAQGLQERVNVLLESLSSGVKAYMPNNNVLELSFLPSQTSAVDEANYATILGFSSDGNNTNIDYVWATNDNNIEDKIDSAVLNFGQSRMTEDSIKEICNIALALNDQAQSQVLDIAENISELSNEARQLVIKTDDASVARYKEIEQTMSELTSKLTVELNQLSSEGMGSYPKYDNTKLSDDQTEFIFYKPVLYRQGTEQNFVRSVVVVEISTVELLKTVEKARDEIVVTASMIAIVAIALGVVGTLILASLIIKPIKKLTKHVEMIRDTEDRTKLEGQDIEITTTDEISILGTSVNEMTHGLVEAAKEYKFLKDGKELQKVLLPLDSYLETTGKKEDDYTQFFGYFEGAKGVSGDYFDFKKLDSKHYALIKCDVSGKGIPASLISAIVATFFKTHFAQWSFKKDGYDLSPFVGKVNDFLESQGFEGRFAAFTLCIYNAENGMLYFCNAGDNLIHVYEAASGTKKTISLLAQPAAGQIAQFMVEMKGGYKVEKLQLNPGDVLFLYTDGIEEAKRLFRDKDFKLINCAEPGLQDGDAHGHHSVGQDGEEMDPSRVNEIIEAVFHKTKYKLEKYHNPIENEELTFDFSACNGTAEDAIMALVAVEKVFRMYKKPDATERDCVKVDNKTDAFLSEHFVQYNDYCKYKVPHKEHGYFNYQYVFEDEQFDDLTLIAIKRKK